MHRVVITGIGAVTSLGNTADEIMDAFSHNKTAFRRSEIDKDLVVCPVEQFNLKFHTGRFKNSRYLTKGSAFALAAAIDAVKDAGISHENLHHAGLFVGAGPNLDLGNEFPDIRNGEIKWDRRAALWVLKFLPNTAASAISQYLDMHGESATFGTACAASLQAMGTAFQKIKWGEQTAALAGGGDSRLSQGALMAYKKADALFNGTGDSDRACRPFDKNRKGFVCGEGGAMFVMEDLEHAQKRGARIYAEICGFAATADGHNMTAPEPDGKWARVAVKKAVEQAGVKMNDIDLVSAHGTSTPLNDAVEADMLKSFFESAATAVMGIKSWIGHLSAACGAAELAISLFCAAKGNFPAIRNLENPCADFGGFLDKPIRFQPKTLLIENFGFGGQNCAMVVKPWKK